MTAAVECRSVVHIHRVDDLEVVALRGVDLTVGTGEVVALVGPSGSGKSTLLALLAGLLRPSAGQVLVLGHDIGRMSERGRLLLRSSDLGVLLQGPEHNLLPHGRVVDALDFALVTSRAPRAARRRRTAELLGAVGLAALATKAVRTLSGGEQQRLALAVSIARAPRLLLADEPTSQLDAAGAEHVGALLDDIRQRAGTTVVVVTHDERLGERLDRSLVVRDGRIGAETRAVGDGRRDGAVIVGTDGSVQLPVDALDLLPPGSRARLVRREGHLELHPASPPAPRGGPR